MFRDPYQIREVMRKSLPLFSDLLSGEECQHSQAVGKGGFRVLQSMGKKGISGGVDGKGMSTETNSNVCNVWMCVYRFV